LHATLYGHSTWLYTEIGLFKSRPYTKAWTDLGNRSSLVAHGKQPVGVVINGQDVSAMKLFTETDLNAMDQGASVVDQIQCDVEGCGHLVISGDTGVWRDVILKASTFTCAVG
jgi:hypothetical protein